MKKLTILVALIGCLNALIAQPIRLYSKNPHYFEFLGKPTVLITSGMHYGAVFNLDIDYNQYLDILSKYKFNLHREFVLGCYEYLADSNWRAHQSPIAPRPGKLCSLYMRSGVSGANDGLNKFDLNQWNNQYFERLKDFCRKAGEKGIVVEISLFSVLYQESTWELFPLYFKNNINNVGHGRYNDYNFIKDTLLFEAQKRLVAKMVTELNDFDNVYFEICNEPYWAKGVPGVEPTIKEQQFLPEVIEWERKLAEEIVKTESKLPKKHLIAQNIANEYYKVDTLCNSKISIVNFHYAFPPKTVKDNYHLGLPISFDETADGCDAPDRRIEAWAFMFAGGAVYDNLDWSFAIDDQSGRGRNPKGPRRSGVEVKQQLSYLKRFLDSIDVANSLPIDSTHIKNLPKEVWSYGLEKPNKSWTYYFLKRANCNIQGTSIKLMKGAFIIKWIDPLDGTQINSREIVNKEDVWIPDFPNFPDDLVLNITKIDQ